MIDYQGRCPCVGIRADGYIAEQPSNIKKLRERPRINKVSIKMDVAVEAICEVIHGKLTILNRCSFAMRVRFHALDSLISLVQN